MVINNAETAILKLLVENPAKEMNIREISILAKVNYRQAYTAVLNLKRQNLLTVKRNATLNLCTVNLVKDIPLLSYIESLRSKDFQKKNPKIQVIRKEIEKTDQTFYSLLVFGSYASNRQTEKSDIDLLFIIPQTTNVSQFEQEMNATLKNLSYPLDINVITETSFKEMRNQKELNVVQKIMNNHIILYGAENYYTLLTQ